MIILKIMGGFGNQMFHYALARELLYYGKSVKADIGYYSNIPSGDTVRNSIKERLFQELPIASDKEIQPFLEENRKLRWKMIRQVPLLQSMAPVYLQKGSYRFDHRLFGRDHVYAIGWWQTEQYFMRVRDSVRTEYLKELGKMEERNERILERIQAHICSVSVHVRGGDYNHPSNIEIFGGICGREYYHKAFEFLRSRFENCHFYVFSNEIAYAKEVLPDLESCEIITNREEDGCQDIFLMSQCTHHIIANSTFSWWGAWLDPNPDKVVVAPAQWSHRHDANPNCEGWVAL